MAGFAVDLICVKFAPLGLEDAVKREAFIDIAERVLIVLFAARFLMQFLGGAPSHPHFWLLIISEMAAVAFILFRPFGQPISTRPLDVALALIGTMLPLLVSPMGSRPEALALAGVVMTLGLLLSISGKVALNRRYGIVAANRGVQVRGPYALIRHPVYAGYTLTQIGFLFANPEPWNLFVYCLAFAAQIARMLVEEKTMGEEYRTYAAKVRFRLVPGLF